MFYDLKNDIFNALILFLARHCHLYSGIYYEALSRITPAELNLMAKDIWKN